MADAEEVVAAVGTAPGSRARRARPQRARLRAARRDRARRGAVRLRRHRVVQRAQPGRVASRSRSQPPRRIVARAREDGLRSTVTLSVAFGCPFEGEVDPARVARGRRARRRDTDPDALVLADTIGVATPGAVRALDRACRRARHPGRRSLPQHAKHRLRQRARRARRGRSGARCVGRRPRRLPLRAERDRQHRDGGPRVRARARGRRDGHRPRRPHRGRSGGSRRCSDGSSRVSCTAPARSRRDELAARWDDRPADLGELDLAGPAAKHDLVAVLEERRARSRRRARPAARRST